MILGGEEPKFSEKACRSAALSTWTGLEMNPVPHGEWSATNRLSHVTAHSTLFFYVLTIIVPAIGRSV
jgi:hypothetical protein